MKTLKIIGFALKEMFWDTPKWVWMDFKQEYEKAEKSRQEKEFKKNWNLVDSSDSRTERDVLDPTGLRGRED